MIKCFDESPESEDDGSGEGSSDASLQLPELGLEVCLAMLLVG